MDATCYVKASDFARHFADIEPLTLCNDCKDVWIATGYERCEACQVKREERLLNSDTDPRR